MSLRQNILRIIKEETNLQSRLLSMVKDIGFKKTSVAVGGPENLLKILGKDKEIVMKYLLSFFDNLMLSHFRGNPILSQGYETFLEKSSSFWGGTINVYDDDILYILKDVPYELYKEYRRDLLKELIRRYPEINDGNEVYVYKNRGKYGRIDKFYVDEENNEEVITESSSIQERLNSLMKTSGVVIASKAVGGFKNLVKILKLDLEDVNAQEMLVKNYIYFADVEDVEVDFIEVKNRANRKLIKIYFGTDSNARNIESWYSRTITDEMNDFFPFKVDVSWHPVNYPHAKIMIDAVIGGVVDFPIE
jgi:hypothetical protein